MPQNALTVLIQTARLDRLRNGGTVLARMLDDMGGEVRGDCFANDGHIGKTAILA